MYLECSRNQQSVYKDSLPSCSDSSSSNSLCSTFAFLLSLAWLLTFEFDQSLDNGTIQRNDTTERHNGTIHLNSITHLLEQLVWPSPSALQRNHWISLDTIGHHWTSLDTIGHHWTSLDIIGHLRTSMESLDINGKQQCYSRDLYG
jgi:hypothetical protein